MEVLENSVLVELVENIPTQQSLIHKYAMLDDENHKLIGEIVQQKKEVIFINLLGELVNQKFIFGTTIKPSFQALVSLLTEEAISILIGMNYSSNQELYIGNNPIYEKVRIGANMNALFSHHFAILGSSGSGKSSGFARVIQNLFTIPNYLAYYANIFLFDAYGEYHHAFSSISKGNPNINFKIYTTDTNFAQEELIRIPIWLLGVDELALLLGVEKHSQIPILEKTLKLVNIFVQEEAMVIKSKNDIIARALLDILSSGRPSTQIRDQIFSILSTYHTKELNLETQIVQPGYTRPLKHCLLIDEAGKIREMELIMEFLHQFLDDNTELSMPKGNFSYTLEDLEHALDFALIEEGILKSDKIYDDNNLLRVRLHSLIHSSNKELFDYPEFVSKEEYIRRLITTSDGRKAQIINFNIEYIDDTLAKVITKIYAKLLFDYSKSLRNRANMAFHIILEEAHRYVQNDNDVYLIGYNIFDRIAKEGRKYGVLLGFISQRPSELSTTALSQCSNFLVFKMIYPDDIQYIYQMIPNMTHEMINQFKILSPGTCIAFGTAFKIPSLIRMEMPNPAPSSSSCDISKVWFIDEKKSNSD